MAGEVRNEDAAGRAAEDGNSGAAIQELHAQLTRAYREIGMDLSWYDLARPHLVLHIRRRIGLLQQRYSALAEEGNESLHAWAGERQAKLEEFKGAFDAFPGSWQWATRSAGAASTALSIAFLVLPGLGITLGVTTASALVVEILNACFCKVWTTSWMVLSAVIIFFVVIGFSIKRDRLLHRNVYALEDRLFRLLAKRRPGELQLDVVGWLALAMLAFGLHYLDKFLETREAFRWDLQPWIHPFWIAGGYALLAAVTAVFSLRRAWAWRGWSPER